MSWEVGVWLFCGALLLLIAWSSWACTRWTEPRQPAPSCDRCDDTGWIDTEPMPDRLQYACECGINPRALEGRLVWRSGGVG